MSDEADWDKAAIEVTYSVVREHFKDLGDVFPRTLSRTIAQALFAAGLLSPPTVSPNPKEEGPL